MLSYDLISSGNQKYIFDLANLALFPVSEPLLKAIESYSTAESYIADLKEACPKLDEAEVEALVKEVSEFIEIGYLTGRTVKKKYPVKATDIPVSSFNVHISHQCNLWCKYCYGEQGTYGKNDGLMTPEMGKQIIDYLFENSPEKKNYQITFFGGEPLLNSKCIEVVMQQLSERCAEENKTCNFSMTTNGTILNDHLIRLFKKHNLYPLLSIDGPQEVHDYLRPYKNGVGSFSEVIQTMQQLKEMDSKKPATGRITLTHYCIDIEKIYFSLKELGFDNVHFSLVCTDNPELAITESDYGQIKDGMKRIVEKELRDIKNGGRSLQSDVKVYMKKLHHRRISYNSCYAGRAKLAVSPNGDLYPCHRFVGNEEYYIGNITTGEIDHSKRQEFFDANIDNIRKCKTCWAKAFCGGGCYQISYVTNGSIYEPDDRYCDWVRFLAKTAVHTYLKLTSEEKKRIGFSKKKGKKGVIDEN